MVLRRINTGVAPSAGAWIETGEEISTVCVKGQSRPLRARGLKLGCYTSLQDTKLSRPLRARGLKPPVSLTGAAPT